MFCNKKYIEEKNNSVVSLSFYTLHHYMVQGICHMFAKVFSQCIDFFDI